MALLLNDQESWVSNPAVSKLGMRAKFLGGLSWMGKRECTPDSKNVALTPKGQGVCRIDILGELMYCRVGSPFGDRDHGAQKNIKFGIEVWACIALCLRS